MNQIGLPEAYDDEDEQIAVSVSGLLEDNELTEEEHELECDSMMIAQDINDEEAIQAIEMIDNGIEEQPLNEIPDQQPWSGFKLVGDNIDKNFRRRFQRVEYQTRSFHYFHSYAVLDRVNYSSLPDIQRDEIRVHELTPNEADVQEMKETLIILVTRY